MKALILCLFLLLGSLSFSQIRTSEEMRTEMITLKKDGYKSLTFGLMTNYFGTSHLFYKSISRKNKVEVFAVFNTVGITLDIMSFTKFYKARKIKKLLSSRAKF